jgi:hypothetical protein
MYFNFYVIILYIVLIENVLLILCCYIIHLCFNIKRGIDVKIIIKELVVAYNPASFATI